MPIVTAPSRGQSNGEEVTEFLDTVSTTPTTYTFQNTQEKLKVKNNGYAAVQVTVNGATMTLFPTESKEFYGSIDSFIVASSGGVQSFEVTGSNYKDEELKLTSNVPIANSRQLMVRTSDPKQLTIPTYDGSGQAVHPSVVYLPTGFNGYKYWMAFTPYPNGNDDYENPSIVASNNGVDWDIPNGLTNPVIPTPADVATGGYNSDPYLLYDGVQLIMYYRIKTAGGVGSMFRVTSSNGVLWSAPTACPFSVDAANASLKPTSIDPIAPSIIRITPSIWYCFFTEGNKLYRTKSSDGITFSHPKQMVHNLPVSGILWHLDVSYHPSGFHAIVASYAANKTNLDNQLHYGYSADGLTWLFDKVPILAANKDSTWYSRQIYKSSLAPHPSGNGHRIYISATTNDPTGKWWMGYFDAIRTNVEAKLDKPVQVILVASGDNVQLAPSSSLLIDNLFSLGKRIAVAVRTTASANFSVDIDHRNDYHGNTTTFTKNIIPTGAARTQDGAQVDTVGMFGAIKINNLEAANTITLHTVIVTIYPD